MFFRRGYKRLLRRTLIVHTKDGRSIRGVLIREYVDCLVLGHAELLDEGISLGGEPVIPLANLSWAQDVTSMDAGRETVAEDRSFEVPRGERP